MRLLVSRRRRGVLTAVVIALGVTMFQVPADAAPCPVGNPCDVTVSLTIVDGTRVFTSAPALTLTGGRPTYTAGYDVVVTEVLKNGANPWTVTATMTDLSSTSPVGTIATNPNAVLSGRDANRLYTLPVPILVTDTSTNPNVDKTGFGSDSGALSSAQTMLKVNTESPATSYSGVFHALGSLKVNVPDGTPAAAYTATMTLTLAP